MIVRGLVQRCDNIEKKLEQPVSSPENKSKVKEWEEEIQDLQKEICLKQHELYRCEAFLPLGA
jgi:HPt (histidine-containing phosphotransfer) domain-containing protein